MVAGVRGREGVHGRGACVPGVCVWHARPPPADTTRYVNERAVRILLECILVESAFIL